MMELYRNIAPYYDLIFSLSAVEKAFYSDLRPGQGERILDIGCGTGQLSLHLAGMGAEVTGVDLDPAMVAAAIQKAGAQDGVSFKVLNMLKIREEFGSSAFRRVFCMGNTVSHLSGREELHRFFGSVSGVLEVGGVFIFQLMNYDRILDLGATMLPVIENRSVKFTRSYEPAPDGKRLLFKTGLTVHGTGDKMENSTVLYPFRREEIEQALAKAGFIKGEYFRGFDRQAWTVGGELLIAVTRK